MEILMFIVSGMLLMLSIEGFLQKYYDKHHVHHFASRWEGKGIVVKHCDECKKFFVFVYGHELDPETGLMVND